MTNSVSCRRYLCVPKESEIKIIVCVLWRRRSWKFHPPIRVVVLLALALPRRLCCRLCRRSLPTATTLAATLPQSRNLLLAITHISHPFFHTPHTHTNTQAGTGSCEGSSSSASSRRRSRQWKSFAQCLPALGEIPADPIAAVPQVEQKRTRDRNWNTCSTLACKFPRFRAHWTHKDLRFFRSLFLGQQLISMKPLIVRVTDGKWRRTQADSMGQKEPKQCPYPVCVCVWVWRPFSSCGPGQHVSLSKCCMN